MCSILDTSVQSTPIVLAVSCTPALFRPPTKSSMIYDGIIHAGQRSHLKISEIVARTAPVQSGAAYCSLQVLSLYGRLFRQVST